MEANIYMDDIITKELYLLSDQMSFSGQFPGWSTVGGPDPASSPFSNAGFLPDWTCGSPSDQLFLQSPTVEVPQESIWLEFNDDFTPGLPWFIDTIQKQRHFSGDDDLLKVVSPAKVSVGAPCHLQNSRRGFYEQAATDCYLVESEPLLDDIISEPQLNVEYEAGDRESDLCGFSAGFDQISSVCDDSYSGSSCTTNASHQVTICQERYQNEVGVLQKVPSSPTMPIDLFGVDCQSLQDPESVFSILRGLVRDSSGVCTAKNSLASETLLSPVSPEDVDTILSFGSLQSSEEISVDLLPSTTAQFSTVSAEELQWCFSPSSSVSHSQSFDSCTISEQYRLLPHVSKSDIVSSCRSSLAFKPYVVTASRREKKKEQNKSAALRYRQKKRQEKGVVLTEVEKLELRNSELKERLDDLNREIGYLRGLLDEINKQ